MWKRLKNFVQSVKRGNSEREKNASRNAEGSGALSDIKSDALTAEEEIMKILEDETLKEIDRSEVIYNVSNCFHGELFAKSAANEQSGKRHRGDKK